MADLQEPCYEGRHMSYVMLLTLPQIVLYVFGLPALAVVHILRNKEHLHQRHFFTRYGLLYMGCKCPILFFGLCSQQRLMLFPLSLSPHRLLCCRSKRPRMVGSGRGDS